jgi:hypothetical protein
MARRACTNTNISLIHRALREFEELHVDGAEGAVAAEVVNARVTTRSACCGGIVRLLAALAAR